MNLNLNCTLGGGPTKFEDYYGALSKLVLTGTVQEHAHASLKLLCKAGQVPIRHQVSCFIVGLKGSIRPDVKAADPSTVCEAMS